MKKIFQWLDKYIEEALCVILMSSMTILIFIQVIMRYVFNNSLSWSEELARYLFIWLIYIGISYGCKMQKHLKIDAALYIFPKKLRPYVRLIGDILFTIFAIYIVYTGWIYSMQQPKYHMHSPALKIPLEYIYMSTVIGYALSIYRQIQAIILHVKELKNENNETEAMES